MKRMNLEPSPVLSGIGGLVASYLVLTACLYSGVTGMPVLAAALLVGILAGGARGSHWGPATVGSLVTLTLLAPSAVASVELVQILILAIAALGLNVLTGWTGQLNLAQGIFVGLGAYVTAILHSSYGWELLLTIPVAGLSTALLGVILGIVALRFTQVYLAVLTAALAFVAPSVLKRFDGLTGGVRGLAIDPMVLPRWLEGPVSTGGWSFNYALVVVVSTLAAYLTWNFVSGPAGRAFIAVRDSEKAASGAGVSVTRYKVLAFLISSFWAGIAGSLYAITVGFINPDSFGLFYGITFLTMIVVGGLGTIGGSFVGAAIIYELMTRVESVGLPLAIGGQELSLPQQGVFGVVLILVMIIAPRGVVGFFHDFSAKKGWSGLASLIHRRSSVEDQVSASVQPTTTGRDRPSRTTSIDTTSIEESESSTGPGRLP